MQVDRKITEAGTVFLCIRRKTLGWLKHSTFTLRNHKSKSTQLCHNNKNNHKKISNLKKVSIMTIRLFINKTHKIIKAKKKLRLYRTHLLNKLSSEPPMNITLRTSILKMLSKLLNKDKASNSDKNKARFLTQQCTHTTKKLPQE
jgi:hypothetical protein